MAVYRYRAVAGDGTSLAGEIEAPSEAEAVALLRQQGAQPVDLRPGAAKGARTRPAKPRRKDREAARTLVAELGVLLGAGLSLDRALALAIGNIDDQSAATALAGVLKAVREGAPLSRAMVEQPGLFTPAEAAMAEAGEANGRLADAMADLARMQQNAAELQRLIGTSMIYPVALLVIAIGVILMMLLFVVPQFEALLGPGKAELPAASRVVIGASRLVREQGLVILAILVGAGLALRHALGRPQMRGRIDAGLLRLPMLGELIRRTETARFARVFGTLVEAGVPLPNALMLARRTIGNSAIGAAIQQVAEGVREGGGLSGPMATAGVLPPLAIGFLRTGEETSRLALMLARLADVLDRDVRTRLERLIAVLTPAITVFLGAVVAGIIASILSAILGFNDLAVAQP